MTTIEVTLSHERVLILVQRVAHILCNYGVDEMRLSEFDTFYRNVYGELFSSEASFMFVFMLYMLHCRVVAIRRDQYGLIVIRLHPRVWRAQNGRRG